MSRRVASSAWLMVLVLGSVVAAQTPSPEVTPSYAPEDISSAVPNRVGALELHVRVAGTDTPLLGSDPEGRAYWTDFLAARGREASDMVAAYGVDLTSGTEPALEVWAIRVTGLDAEQLVEPTLVTTYGSDLSEIPAGGHADWRSLDGRRVLVLTRDDVDDWRAYYPYGEVLFVAFGDDRVAVEDVMPALAPRVVAQSSEPPARPAPWFEGRVEVPGHGVAFSVPPGWVGIDLWGDVDRQLAEVSGPFGRVSCKDCEQSLRAGIDRVTTTDDWLVLLDPTTGDACAVTIGYAGSSALSLADLAENVAEDVAALPTVTGLEAPVYLDVLLGSAVRINMTIVNPDQLAPSGATIYMALDEERRHLVIVSCSALAERPSDDWRSIAETFVFLPTAE